MAGATLVALARWRAPRFTRFAITSVSMQPALAAGDYVVVATRDYARRAPRPGEIAIACDPREPDRVIAKRVAALSGEDDVFLLGDNRAASSDSRTFGPVPRSSLLGRVRWRYWPPTRFGPVR